jgi:hypothetical protein
MKNVDNMDTATSLMSWHINKKLAKLSWDQNFEKTKIGDQKVDF